MNCPVCNHIETSQKYEILRHGFTVWECQSCFSQFQYPMPKKPNRYYDEGYYSGTANFSYQDERRQEYFHNFVHYARLKNIISFLGPAYNGAKEKFLDVGAAFGAFTRAASRYFAASGLDVSPYAVKEGNKISAALQSQAQLFKGDLNHAPRTLVRPNAYTAITLIEVAEHLRTPRVDFKKAYTLLKPGGVLVIQTANFEGWQAVRGGSGYHYYLPGHLIYYTATGLKRLLHDIGFREFKEFFPVDFPLSAKWCKAWGDVKGLKDVLRFWRMSWYHMKSKIHWRGRPLTSSYVLYARK